MTREKNPYDWEILKAFWIRTPVQFPSRTREKMRTIAGKSSGIRNHPSTPPKAGTSKDDEIRTNTKNMSHTNERTNEKREKREIHVIYSVIIDRKI